MKRFIDDELIAWKTVKFRMPLLLRGARQVGKTYAAQQLGKQFASFIEVNLETQDKERSIFEKDLDVNRILRDLSLLRMMPIVPGETLLFIDEIQAVPNAVTALRYFYEQIPDLHVIAAGSLLDFAIEQVGMPVGRVESLYMYPMSFLEFLFSMNGDMLVSEILSHPVKQELSEPVHQKILSLLGEYIAIGGMPKVVACWSETKDPMRCFALQHAIIDTYRNDFVKYTKKNQIKYVDTLFNAIPQFLGKKFKYSDIACPVEALRRGAECSKSEEGRRWKGDFRKRELAPALELLVTAGVVHKITHSSGQGIPLGANVDSQNYKVIFLDIALTQAILGLDLAEWFLNSTQQFVNKGALVESLVGQELLAYANSHAKSHLYYWQRNAPSSTAEVDYLVQRGENIIPIEVKSGAGKTLKSLHLFLESHTNTPYGVRFSMQNYSEHDRVQSLPLYAVAAITNRFKK
jgi:predicted AAA+ superfamily ATPase